MLTLQSQLEINKLWQDWKKDNNINPIKQKKQHLCPKCAKQNYKVKMDYLGNKQEKIVTGVYDVSYYHCPRCKYVAKEYARTPRGTIGKRYGGI